MPMMIRAFGRAALVRARADVCAGAGRGGRAPPTESRACRARSIA